jgi:hypothetical protein
MLTPIRFLCWLLISLAVLIPSFAGAEPNTGGGPSIFNCTGIPRTCGAWAPKGANTCRTCKQALCKNDNGKEVLAGNKTETECYQGHGPAPLQRGKINVPKAPTSGLKQ